MEPLFLENSGNDPRRVEWSQVGAGETNGTSMFSAVLFVTKGDYLAAFIGLKELAVVGLNLTNDSNGGAGVQKCLHWAWLRVFEAKRTPSLNHLTGIHY